ncbi:MAG: transcriptional regulator, partial [Roseobacter sp.]|nr:transcriptional regulator [Roseobacter sp.]
MTETIKHHLNDAILMAYSAGSLPEAFNLIVAAHLSLCDTCRAQAESFDALGGEVLDQQHGARLSDTSYNCTIDLIDGGPVSGARPMRVHRKGVLPQPVQEYVGGDLDDVRWKPVGMGVKQAILPTSSEASARLLLIPA